MIDRYRRLDNIECFFGCILIILVVAFIIECVVLIIMAFVGFNVGAFWVAGATLALSAIDTIILWHIRRKEAELSKELQYVARIQELEKSLKLLKNKLKRKSK